ncbi:MAG: hypothetical protein JW746_06190 [Candidatus Krumholzibacteriota bacterium]|nr:hypothetical protein [Candidatus Krumholzibacteriota bacterium]
MDEKIPTIKEMKKSRQVPDELKARVKEYGRIKKEILKALETKRGTIPEIAASTGLRQEVVTYTLMTMRKFHEIEVEGLDDMDEYYYYRKAEV